MTRFEHLVESYEAGSQVAIDIINSVFEHLREKQITVIREFYGIGCTKKSKEEIGDLLGMDNDEIDHYIQRTIEIIETNIWRIDDRLLKTLPEFIQLKKELGHQGQALTRYKNFKVSEFVHEYQTNEHLHGYEVYDRLMRVLVSSPLADDNSDQKSPAIYGTTFPITYNDKMSLDESVKNLINEMIAYYDKTSQIAKNAKRKNILHLYFYENKSPQEIAKSLGVSRETVRDNFLTPLFGAGQIDDISILSSFHNRLKTYVTSHIYDFVNNIESETGFNHDRIKQVFGLFGEDIFSSPDYNQEEIIIHDGDIHRVKASLFGLFDVLSKKVVPLPVSEICSEVRKVVDASKLLEDYIEIVIRSNPSIIHDSAGHIYLDEKMMKTKAHRFSRIIYNAPGHILRKKEIDDTYLKIYNEEIGAYPQKNLAEVNVYMISEGVYQYSIDGRKLKTLHEFMDEYMQSKVLFRWSELLPEMKKLNPLINSEESEKTYTTKRCTVCSTDSDLMVLKGNEGNYPQYIWNSPIKRGTENFIVNQAVDILKKQAGHNMRKRTLMSDLNAIAVANGYSNNNIQTIIKKYTVNDPKIFIKEQDDIRLDDLILQQVNLDYIGKGYKYADFYVAIYAMAISEIKKRKGQKILRSEITEMAAEQIDPKIDGRIVCKAFDDSSKPAILTVEGIRKNAYICLDMDALKKEEASVQYKVDKSDSSKNTDTTPQMVVDTEQRPEVSYRKVFNWGEILSALKQDLRHYEKPFFYPGITSDDVLGKFQKFMSNSKNVYLNNLIPQAYYELSYANVDKWSAFDYRSKIATSFESLLSDIYYQNNRVELNSKGLGEVIKLYQEFDVARQTFDRKGFAGIFNYLYTDRNHFAHTSIYDLPNLLSSIQSCISYMALFVYTVAKYYKG